MSCYAMVRGSGIRLTDLDVAGRYNGSGIRYAASKAVVSIQINEITESGGNELIRNGDDEPRLHFITDETTIRYEADINFLRCDPQMLQLMTGVPLAFNALGNIVGFDATTRLPLKAFALEVWSKLAGVACIGTVRPYGYTLFPFLKGGTIGGFAFANGLVSFNVKGARTQRGSKWGVGPYDLEGPFIRLTEPVSRNTSWRSFVTAAQPPAQTNGVITFEDIIYGGNAAYSSPDILSGDPANGIVDGGRA